MSPNTTFPLHERPQNAITERILQHPRVTFDVEQDVLVIALKDELLVRASHRAAEPRLNEELSKVASRAGSLGERTEHALDDDVEVWRLNDPEDNSIDQARRLRTLTQQDCVKTRWGPSMQVPPISPNHVCTVSRPYDCCPDGPPHPTPPPARGAGDEQFVRPPTEPDRPVRVVVIDSGYIRSDPPHVALDDRVAVLAGQWLDTSTIPAVWRDDAPDMLDADHDGRLDGVAGHGTFVAGLVAHHCRDAEITVVGQRHQCLPLDDPPDPVDQAMLFMAEFDVAHSLLTHADADVISCGFAFPTLDQYPSIPFTSVMSALTGPKAPRPGVAVVAPAGNERSARPYWPAAHPDVIGVASTNRRGTARAQHSNWGPWCNCCARGQDVFSTYVTWLGPIEGEPPSEIDNFVGWATWNGTSFATPKVSGAIARLVSETGLEPIAAFARLVSGHGGVTVTPLPDATLSPFPGVTLPHLHLG